MAQRDALDSLDELDDDFDGEDYTEDGNDDEDTYPAGKTRPPTEQPGYRLKRKRKILLQERQSMSLSWIYLPRTPEYTPTRATKFRKNRRKSRMKSRQVQSSS